MCFLQCASGGAYIQPTIGGSVFTSASAATIRIRVPITKGYSLKPSPVKKSTSIVKKVANRVQSVMPAVASVAKKAAPVAAIVGQSVVSGEVAVTDSAVYVMSTPIGKAAALGCVEGLAGSFGEATGVAIVTGGQLELGAADLAWGCAVQGTINSANAINEGAGGLLNVTDKGRMVWNVFQAASD